MKQIEINYGRNKLYCNINDNDKILPSEQVVATWENGYHNTVAKNDTEQGLRVPQFGALCAIRSHWTISNEAATVVMPTGTGKTETMLATIVAEKCIKTLIIVPSNLLRQQFYEKAKHLGILFDIGVLDAKVLTPNVAFLGSTPKSIEELKELVEPANIIITTMTLAQRFSKKYSNYLSSKCETLIVDEAHHISAKTWSDFKSWFNHNRILQFTATPFRNDDKKIDGKIIYNFPLSKAQELGYFKPITFYPIEEFNDSKSDLAIAEKAVKILIEDINNGFEHILLVRTNTTNKAEELYNNIYNKKYKKFNPVLITSKVTEKQKKQGLKSLNQLTAKIVVCVDMFGEGIDIPNLKVVALHDKYKSLPITLQFIGRFARSKKGLGDSKVITNIVNEDVHEAISELYEHDADWNQLLSFKSDYLINNEISLQELESGFKGNEINSISIKNIKIKVSMLAFKVNVDTWNYEEWNKVFDQSSSKLLINKEEHLMVIINRKEENVGWSNQRDFSDIVWELHVLYWNKDQNIVFMNSTDKSKGSALVEAVFGKETTRITGESIFRSLHGINRLMLGTVGLNYAINGPVRYRMFAGIDIAQGITEATTTNSYKSNLFGIGYNGNGKTSIGCSYKGTVWAKWVENIDYWKKWCNVVIEKILDPNIDTKKILDGVLIPKPIDKIPKIVPYRIDWPNDLDFSNDSNLMIKHLGFFYPLYEVEIGLSENQSKNNAIMFYIGNDNFQEEFELTISGTNYAINSINNVRSYIIKGKNKQLLTSYFFDYPPVVKFVDQSTLEGNLYIALKNPPGGTFPKQHVISWNWGKLGVNIKKESQTSNKFIDSIQYAVIKELKKSKDYIVIFDDDNSGEIADVIAIKELNREIIFELYHCKYSHGDKPGSRVSDLYEVCGQAEKSVMWKQDTREIINRMIKREQIRLKNNGVSRIEEGDLQKLKEIHNKLRIFNSKMLITIVQPGVDSKNITPDMERILVSTQSYLMETYSIKLKLICS